jgi:tetratricopeptide (TPR) repeat protein
MKATNKDLPRWRRNVALLVATGASIAALVALRGPDLITGETADATGAWLLSGPRAWNANAAFGLLAQPAYALAGPRAWQNLHVVTACLAVLCWLIPLSAQAWRGLTPLIPALLATMLSTQSSGFAGFGLAVLMLCAWRNLTFGHAASAHTFPIAAWLAAWLSPGALPVVFAFALEADARWTRKQLALAGAAAAVAVSLTPRSLSVWHDAWNFIIWTPSLAPDAAGTIALLLNVAALALALRWSLGNKSAGVVFAPILLLICASQGQTSYLWASALMTIPLWVPAKEQLRGLGVNLRWWAGTALVALAVLLAAASGFQRLNDWYNLAMARETAQPTLTRAALPAKGPVYINPQGLAAARFAGALPERVAEGETSGMAREPRLWRAQDRTARYRAVWLLGDKADYAPLARHLGESPDWRLAAADAAGLLFLREAREEVFATEPAQQLARSMVGAANRSRFLSGAALACLAAQYFSEADELSRAAVRRSDLSSDTAAARALVLVSLGRVAEALEQSLLAARLVPDSSVAWQARAETLLHAGRADEAYAAAQRAAELAPGDEGALWLAARAANAARALQSEAEILERLVALTAGRGGDAGFYQLYLGQSYAKQGLARPALRAMEKAAAAPGLTGEQRSELQEEVARIRASAEGD